VVSLGQGVSYCTKREKHRKLELTNSDKSAILMVREGLEKSKLTGEFDRIIGKFNTATSD
jgi:hypothetical protein